MVLCHRTETLTNTETDLSSNDPSDLVILLTRRVKSCYSKHEIYVKMSRSWGFGNDEHTFGFFFLMICAFVFSSDLSQQ